MSSSVTLGVGQQVQVSATFAYANQGLAPDESIVWASDTPSVATVPSSGSLVQITAVAIGSANITATSGVLTNSIAVTVIAVAPAYLNLVLGSPTGP